MCVLVGGAEAHPLNPGDPALQVADMTSRHGSGETLNEEAHSHQGIPRSDTHHSDTTSPRRPHYETSFDRELYAAGGRVLHIARRHQLAKRTTSSSGRAEP
jgi:hypothetical protein